MRTNAIVIALVAIAQVQCLIADKAGLGIVQNAYPKWGLVIVDVGADKGLQVGDLLTLSSKEGSSYDARVSRVNQSTALAEVLIRNHQAAMEVMAGDHIKSRPERPAWVVPLDAPPAVGKRLVAVNRELGFGVFLDADGEKRLEKLPESVVDFTPDEEKTLEE